MSFGLSVSVVCLPPPRRAEMVETLSYGPADDLHCDILGTEPGTGITGPELLRMLDLWPRSLSIHQWSSGVPMILDEVAPSARRRLIVEVAGRPAMDSAAVSMAAGAGWHVLVGCRPDHVDAALDLVRSHDCAGVQLLTTSTPGRAGGRFIESAWSVIPRLRAALGVKSLELDGGISTSFAQRASSLGCDMVVLGTNALGLGDDQPLVPSDLEALLQDPNAKDLG